jgi:hypothetical protein
MRTLSFFIEDDRYAVPTLDFVTAPDRRRALALAKRRLGESSHHLAVDVFEDDKPLGHLVRG